MTARALVMAIVGAAALVGAACGSTGMHGASSEAITTPPTTAPPRPTTSSTTARPPTTADSKPSACSDLDGHAGPDQICIVHTEAPGYTIDMRFATDYPDQKALSAVLVRQRDQFVETVSEPPVRDVPKALDVKSTTYRSGSPESGTDSIVLEEFVNVGGAHPETYYDALSYDVAQAGADHRGHAVQARHRLRRRARPHRAEGVGGPPAGRPSGCQSHRRGHVSELRSHRRRGDLLHWPRHVDYRSCWTQQVSIPRSVLGSILA